jgi:dimethylhistidine N-methyltransferase
MAPDEPHPPGPGDADPHGELDMDVHTRTLVRPADRRVASQFAADVVAGLGDEPKHLPPKYFYDARGSELFEEITRLPEYYPTRTELSILRDNAEAIAACCPDGAALVEFGAGSIQKARIVLQAARQVSAYVPVDISSDFLASEAARFERELPAVEIFPVAADFMGDFDLPRTLGDRPRVGFFPGSTIGNFEPHEAARFLRRAGRLLGRGATLIVGVDLVKDAEVLRAAYNDSAGVTAAFNMNLLRRMENELGAELDVSAFRHYAFYNRERRRIEMHLASCAAQSIRVCGRTFDLRRGETIHTENSYKYTPDGFRALAAGAGWRPVAIWTDAKDYFSVHALILA